MYKPARQFSPSPGPQGGDRRGTNHHRRKKFFNSAVVKTVPLSCFERGRWVQCLTQFGNFTPFEYEMIVSKVDMIQGWRPERDTGLGGNGHTAPNPGILNPFHLDCSPRIFYLDPYQ